MFSSYKLKIILLFLVLFTTRYWSQEYSFLPEPVKTTKEYLYTGSYDNAMKFNTAELEKYKKINDQKNMAAVYINIGNLLFITAKYKESIEYLNKAKEILRNDNTVPSLKAYLFNEYGKNYSRLGLFEQSGRSFNLSQEYINKIPDQKQKVYYLSLNYSWKRQLFFELKATDSMLSVEKKMLQIDPGIISYTRIADRFIEQKQPDSAEYYMNKALSFSDKATAREKAIAWFSYGDLYTVKKDHQKALDYYLKSLSILESYGDLEILVAYDSISSTYKHLNNFEKSNEYLRKYTNLSNTIDTNKKAAVDLAVAKLMEFKNKEKEREENKLYILIAAIIIISIAAVFITKRIYLNKQLKKDQQLEEKNAETYKLKMQINDSFEELAKLMNERSPLFLIRFKEVYPDFYEKLLAHTPNISEHDLKFCAYMRLNLSSKEICQLEYTSIRTAQTKKYRLKKKLNIPTETDLQKWILEL
ncbi:hypothetical protein CW752_16455 [Chryseobacterium sp. PMSZPI]|nr:hypothetical protein CW752_16455 [Chryseobacterium sp. PMSZPI]